MKGWMLASAIVAGCISNIANSQSIDQIEAYEQRIEAQQQQLDEMRRELDALKAAFAESGYVESPVQDLPNEREEPDRKVVLRKTDNVSLTVSGRVHRMLLTVDDGASTGVFFTDSEQGPTMLRFDALGRVSDSLSIGAALETGIRQNRPFLVSQDNPSVSGADITVRHAEAFIESSRYGKMSLGRGFAAAWLAPEIDLSGTQFASLLPVGMLAPGMKFVDASDNSLSDVQVLTHFVDAERLLLVDRVRYDSPKFGPGVQISGSLADDRRWDLALRVKPVATQDWTIVGGASFQNKPFEGIEQRRDAGISVRHNSTGLNLTIAGTNEDLTAGRDANSYIVKAGWLADIVDIGKTAFSVDFTRVSDLRIEGDEAESIGLFAVQKWPDFGLDFYAGYRRYDVSRPDIQLKNLNVLALGVAFGF